MSWAADGQDGNGLRLGKTGLIFSRLTPLLENLLKTLITVYFLCKNLLDIFFLLVIYKHFVYDKGT